MLDFNSWRLNAPKHSFPWTILESRFSERNLVYKSPELLEAFPKTDPKPLGSHPAQEEGKYGKEMPSIFYFRHRLHPELFFY